MKGQCLLSLAAALLFASGTGRAQPVFHFRMDSQTLFADDIVLCEEQEVRFGTMDFEYEVCPGRIGYYKAEGVNVRCRVIRTFKGSDLAPDATFEAESDVPTHRCLPGKTGYTVTDHSGTYTVPPVYLPPGRALLFLHRAPGKDCYYASYAVFIQPDGLYRYSATSTYTGGMVRLARPEYFSLPEDGKYGEAELLADLAIALDKAASLKEPVRCTEEEACAQWR